MNYSNTRTYPEDLIFVAAIALLIGVLIGFYLKGKFDADTAVETAYGNRMAVLVHEGQTGN